MSTFLDYVKAAFWVLLLLQFAPPLFRGIKHQWGSLSEPKTKIGLVHFKGGIYSSSKHVKQLEDFFKDKDIKAIVLKFECIGGAAASSQMIFHELLTLKAQYKKPVVALVENICASGGYYIASGSDYIIASPASLVGSIGVYISHPQFKEFIEQFKIKYDIIKSGAYKGALNPLLETNPEERAAIQAITDSTYQQFVSDVAQQRTTLSANTKKWAEGLIFTGEQALALGLIDELGSQSAVIKKLHALVPFEGDIDWVVPAVHRGLLQSLFLDEAGEEEADSRLNSFVNGICNALESRYSNKVIS